jgi:hypothetical protein
MLRSPPLTVSVFLLAIGLTCAALLFADEPTLPRPAVAPDSSAYPLSGGVHSLAAPGVENLFQLVPNVLSGSQPAGDEGFQALRDLGVTTIVSVDGTRPEVARARQFGLRYIHLPIGYDGISLERCGELTKIGGLARGKIFVHCHHGKHRGPAAAAILVQASGAWSAAQAEAWLQAAGTSNSYRGLWQSVGAYRLPSTETLAKLPNEFPEAVDPPDTVATMLAIDERWQRLVKTAREGGPAEGVLPQDAAQHQTAVRDGAVQLAELVREWLRTPAFRQQPEPFRAEAEQFLHDIAALENSVTRPTALATAVQRIEQRCTHCHEGHRN